MIGNEKILSAFQKGQSITNKSESSNKTGTQRGTSKRLKKLRDRTVRNKTNDATLSNLNEYVSNLITEISSAQVLFDILNFYQNADLGRQRANFTNHSKVYRSHHARRSRST